MTSGQVFALILVIFAFVTIAQGVRTVPQGSEWTVERFGRYTTTLRPGLHLLIPFIDRIGRRLSVQEQVMDVSSQEVITKDNAIVTVDGVVFFQVIDTASAAYEVRNLILAISNLAQTNIRTVIGSLDLDEVLSQRDHINDRLLKVVDAATHPWGVKVTRIEIKDLTPPPDITEAMARQMKAERLRRAQILEAEGERESARLRAEGQKQAAILTAEGQRQAAILAAEARREAAFRDAEAREREAEAEAKATQMMSQAIAMGDVQAVNYFVAQEYLRTLSDFARSNNQKTLLLPLETTGVLGTLAGIGALAQEAFTKQPDGTVPTGAVRRPAGSVPRQG